MALLPFKFDETAFDAYLESQLVIDRSRKEFLDDTKKTLSALCSGTLTRCTGFRRLLLGLKGVGKTTLLEELGLAARLATKDQILVCWIAYSKTSEDPVSHMFKSLPWTARAHHTLKCRGPTIGEVNKSMQELGLRMLVIIDELENVFLSECIRGKDIINQLYAIGDLNGGAVHCILSGNSSDIRELAFGELPDEKRGLYANYTGRDLNSTKFSPRWIFPFCNRDDFILAVKHMKKRFAAVDALNKQDGVDDELLEDEWNGVFIKTCGIGRLIEEYALTGKVTYTYSASAKDYLVKECFEGRVLLSIYHCLSLYSARFKSSFDWMATVSVLGLRESDLTRQLIVDKKMLYKMADQCLIRYYDDRNEVAFANPLIFWETDIYSRSFDSKRVNFDEIHHLALFRLGSTAQMAESICLRFLAEKSTVWCTFQCKYTIGTQVMPLLLPNLGPLEDVIGRLWKETLCDGQNKAYREALGADATLIEKTGEREYVVHRLQLWLGSGRGKTVTEKTIDTFKRNADTAWEIYNQAGFIGHTQHWYLVATHDFDPADRELLAQSKITLIDRAILAGVWPEEVKRIIGKPYA